MVERVTSLTLEPEAAAQLECLIKNDGVSSALGEVPTVVARAWVKSTRVQPFHGISWTMVLAVVHRASDIRISAA